jgi:DTW domain-containing protein YfiP/predicted GNAT family N-acyltransferase
MGFYSLFLLLSSRRVATVPIQLQRIQMRAAATVLSSNTNTSLQQHRQSSSSVLLPIPTRVSVVFHQSCCETADKRNNSFNVNEQVEGNVIAVDWTELKAFYKTNNEHAQHLPFPKQADQTWVLLLQSTNECNNSNSIVAALRLCRQDSQQHSLLFLRALVVAKTHRRQGLASHLLRHALLAQQHENANATVYCFCQPGLVSFYNQHGFSLCTTTSTSTTSNNNLHRIHSKLNQLKNHRQNDKQQELVAMLRPPLIKILVLQHVNEVRRTLTATAPLANHVLGLDIQTVSWSGRIDNERVIKVLTSSQVQQPVLLWTGGKALDLHTMDASGNTSATTTKPTWIVLDGTWQEAKRMYQKVPFLWTLPKVSIQTAALASPSTYHLRQNFGWKQRFGETNETLLCTAEVIAAIADHCGQTIAGETIRRRLDDFQKEFRTKYTK